MTDQEILIKISSQLGRVEGSVDGLRGEVKGVRRDMQALNDEVIRMPDRWSDDITKAIKSCQKSRDDVSEAVDLAEERLRAKYGRKKDSDPAIPRPKPEGWFKGFAQTVLKPIVGILFVAGMAIGAGIAVTQCGAELDKEALQETRHQMDQLQDQLKKVKNAPLP